MLSIQNSTKIIFKVGLVNRYKISNLYGRDIVGRARETVNLRSLDCVSSSILRNGTVVYILYFKFQNLSIRVLQN